jgi:hypothetical protein
VALSRSRPAHRRLRFHAGVAYEINVRPLGVSHLERGAKRVYRIRVEPLDGGEPFVLSTWDEERAELARELLGVPCVAAVWEKVSVDRDGREHHNTYLEELWSLEGTTGRGRLDDRSASLLVGAGVYLAMQTGMTEDEAVVTLLQLGGRVRRELAEEDVALPLVGDSPLPLGPEPDPSIEWSDVLVEGRLR